MNAKSNIEPLRFDPAFAFGGPGGKMLIDHEALGGSLEFDHPYCDRKIQVVFAGGDRQEQLHAAIAKFTGEEDDPFEPGRNFKPAPVEYENGDTSFSLVIFREDDSELTDPIGYATLRYRLSVSEGDETKGDNDAAGDGNPSHLLYLHPVAAFVTSRYRHQGYGLSLACALYETAACAIGELAEQAWKTGRPVTVDVFTDVEIHSSGGEIISNIFCSNIDYLKVLAADEPQLYEGKLLLGDVTHEGGW